MAAPIIPPRPARSQNIDVPTVPPRPRKSMELSVSQDRDTYARSPLNDPNFLSSKPGLVLSKSASREIPPRPPSVSLPSIGQEGEEYAQLHQSDEHGREPTNAVAGDLPLHAPKASLPISTAQTRIQAVTRTDSDSAAAAGIGKPRSEAGDQHSTSSQHGGSKPSSLFRFDSADPNEQGIPEIGMQIPLYKNAGDVQAPTPSSSVPPPATGIGYFNKGDAGMATPKNHYRTKSGREVFNGPPGSYGMHGHGLSHDPLEKAWYDRHPQEKARENQGQYGPKIPMDRQDYHLSSASLNQLIQTRSDELGESHVSTPDERIGYLASDEYNSRMSTPRSSSKRRSVQHSDSPLKAVISDAKADAAADEDDDDEDDIEDNVIHVNQPEYSSTNEVSTPGGPRSLADDDERDILPTDETAIRVPSRYMTPAIEPDTEKYERDGSQSRPHSRANSIQHSHAPIITRSSSDPHACLALDDVKEYDPLFPEDADMEKLRLQRRSSRQDDHHHPRHQFRSKDVWEDAPDSAMDETTVETPQIENFSRREAEHEPKEIFDSDEQELRKPKVSKPLIKKAAYNKGILADVNHTRAIPRNRFPSQDTWEDAPDSALQTAELESEDDAPSSVAKGAPIVPARPVKFKESTSPIETKRAPTIPDRPKPQAPSKEKPTIPARPAGGKIASLRSGFMNDLESRLKSGPQAVSSKATETEEDATSEKITLTDARKGRARGPARRKPGGNGDKDGSSSTDAPAARPKVSFVSAVTIWQVDEDGILSVGSKPAHREILADVKEKEPEQVTVVEDSKAENEE